LVLKRDEGFKYDTITISCSAEKLTNDNSKFVTSDSTIFIANVECRTNTDAKTGKYSVILDRDHPYGFTVWLNNIVPCEEIYISVWHKNNTGTLNIAMQSPDPSIFFQARSINDSSINCWKFYDMKSFVPYNYSLNEMKFYLWNIGGQATLVDDFTIKLIKKSNNP
jgi:hypothetical protein